MRSWNIGTWELKTILDMRPKNPSIHDNRYRRLIESLCRLRKNAGISQKELAKKLGFAQPDISKIEACERRIDVLETLDWITATSGGDVTPALLEVLKDLNVSLNEKTENIHISTKTEKRVLT